MQLPFICRQEGISYMAMHEKDMSPSRLVGTYLSCGILQEVDSFHYNESSN